MMSTYWAHTKLYDRPGCIRNLKKKKNVSFFSAYMRIYTFFSTTLQHRSIIAVSQIMIDHDWLKSTLKELDPDSEIRKVSHSYTRSLHLQFFSCSCRLVLGVKNSKRLKLGPIQLPPAQTTVMFNEMYVTFRVPCLLSYLMNHLKERLMLWIDVEMGVMDCGLF